MAVYYRLYRFSVVLANALQLDPRPLGIAYDTSHRFLDADPAVIDPEPDLRQPPADDRVQVCPDRRVPYLQMRSNVLI